MIIKKEKIKGGITKYIIGKEIEDVDMSKILNTYVSNNQIDKIIKESCDVYTKEGKLLLKFRKNALSKSNMDEFYKNIITFAHVKTSNRGLTSGAKKGETSVSTNPYILSNIFGYMNSFSSSQNALFRRKGYTPPLRVRECRYNMEHPLKYSKTIPFLENISGLFKRLIPSKYKKQNDKAKETYFRIGETAFTTVTTNINFRTTIHTDKGDDVEGFGNVVVFEREGSYTGGETCFPQYGIGVDVREGDILLMDVHEPHGNLPIKLKTKGSERLSVVCYLRRGVWENTRGKSKAYHKEYTEQMKKVFGFGNQINKNPESKTKKKKKNKKTKRSRSKSRSIKEKNKKTRKKKTKMNNNSNV